MSSTKPAQRTLSELGDLLRTRAVSPTEAVRATLDRITELNGTLNAYITVLADQAEAQAREAEREIRSGRYRGPLHGVPISVKDLFHIPGARTTCGSKILQDFVPTEVATAVQRLRSAGAVLVGKTNLHEFAFGVTNINPVFGTVRNPWDLDRIAGGSSGGSAAAVSAALCSASLGTDTGGSIRIPSALCGIVGLKPTYGRVSRHGVVPLSWSLDHVGPMTRSVKDAALMLGVIAGRDGKDPSSARAPVPDFASSLPDHLRGIRLGIPREYFFDQVDAEVLEAVRRACRLLEESGATSREVSIPRMDSIPSMYLITYAEAASYHEKNLRERPGDYGADVRGHLEFGSTLLATDYLKAQRLRNLFRRELKAVFETVDALLTPTVPVPAPRSDQSTVTIGNVEEDVRSALLRFTRPFNLAGVPALSVPCGWTRSGLPIG
ncbi:MAG: Asp-tRNA(Asn)/Glu-tRNA(Gln) amidotransferase subunit GatA, partial [Acidobacteria bacterium]|nr:Asp-tRNA(Asn)/Glu-tRNA(Gln) amidotransferase subunit GatA [Acidobacteriota bacterium]